jgi:ligand-binding sensor domain-containing protein
MLRKSSLLALLSVLLIAPSVQAQIQPVGQWRSHLPYRLSTHVAQAGPWVYVASGSGLFRYHADQKFVEPLTKVEGLTDVDITALAYDPVTDWVVVGYRNGNLDLIRDEKIVNVPELLRTALYPGKKKINHIHCGLPGTPRAGRALLSTDFGVVEMNLDNQLVLGTYLVGPNAQEVVVNGTTTRSDSVWVATASGLTAAGQGDAWFNPAVWRRHAQWEGQSVLYVSAHPALVNPLLAVAFATSAGDSLSVRRDGTWNSIDDGLEIPSSIYQVVPRSNGFWVARSFDILEVVPGAGSTWQIDPIMSPGTGNNAGFRPRGLVWDAQRQILWTANSFRGLSFKDNPTYAQHRVPPGPPSGNVFSLATPGDKVYVAPGAMDATWTAQFNNDGVFVFQEGRWSAIQDAAIGNAKDIVAAAANPQDTSQVYLGSWGKGLVHLQAGQLVNRWDATNSPLGPALASTANDVRVGGLAFAPDGTLWMTASLAQNNLYRLTPNGEWTAFNLGQFSGEAIRDIARDEDGRLWMISRTKGLVCAEITGTTAQVRRITSGEGDGNLPSPDVQAMLFDQDGELWVGTTDGLAVIYTPYNVFKPGRSVDAQPILREENGVVQKVLGSERITCMALDGGNRKWIGTQSGGLFLLSPDGLEELMHLTSGNSPLLSDRITALAVDPFTGEVFIGTDRGLQSYRAGATQGGDLFGDVVAFPNPVPPDHTGPITVRGLKANVNCKVTDGAGRLVYEAQAWGGSLVWPGTTLTGERAPGGIYQVYCTDALGQNTLVATVAVAR